MGWDRLRTDGSGGVLSFKNVGYSFCMARLLRDYIHACIVEKTANRHINCFDNMALLPAYAKQTLIGQPGANLGKTVTLASFYSSLIRAQWT